MHYDKRAINSILSIPFIQPKGNKLNSQDPAFQYQTQKKIQNTVRVPSSIYTMDLGSLNVYQKPDTTTHVNWNQMSDRTNPHHQTHGSSTKRSQTRERPGATTPGGKGVDIKHNSYTRYMNRIKGCLAKGGPIPTQFGDSIVFQCAYPIYGGKTMKTSIVSNCYKEKQRANGVQFSPKEAFESNAHIYFNFVIGQQVYARVNDHSSYRTAIIIKIIYESNQYEVEFLDTGEKMIVSPFEKRILPILSSLCKLQNVKSQRPLVESKYKDDCLLLNKIATPDITAILKEINTLISI